MLTENLTSAASEMSTESKILQAAEEEFMVKGFAGARTTAIAERAGVTHAMLHYYFRTKQKLFDHIIFEKSNLLKQLLLDSVSNEALSLRDTLKAVIEKHLEFISQNPMLPHFLISEIIYNERGEPFLNKVKTMGPTMLRLLQNKIDAEATKGNCRKIDARMLMIDILSLNIFPYIAAPAINAATGNLMKEQQKFLELRKIENIDTIMRKLAP